MPVLLAVLVKQGDGFFGFGWFHFAEPLGYPERDVCPRNGAENEREEVMLPDEIAEQPEEYETRDQAEQTVSHPLAHNRIIADQPASIRTKTKLYTKMVKSDVLAAARIRIADEVFIALALLHKQHPERADFTIGEIVERVRRENLFGELRPGVRVHVSLHCVANRKPNPGTYAMLYATGERTRRLLLATDDVHADRTGKMFPDPEEIPARYRKLVEWARARYGKSSGVRRPWLCGVIGLYGAGGELWGGQDPDGYVRELREGWE